MKNNHISLYSPSGPMPTAEIQNQKIKSERCVFALSIMLIYTVLYCMSCSQSAQE